MKGIACGFLLLSSVFAFGQADFSYLREETPLDSFPKRSLTTHQTLKPFLLKDGELKNKPFSDKLIPILDLNYIQTNNVNFKTGLGLEYKGKWKDKWYYRLSFISGVTKTDSNYIPRVYFLDSIGNKTSFYTDVRARVSYSPNKFFNFQTGLDNHFIGEGSRSLFLSDYSSSYPFALLKMNVWRAEYAILYQFLREREGNDYFRRWKGKFAATHHLSVNITKWLNAGFFETVIFQPKDTLLNRGFDVEYLNPFIMYRPQEYSLGSSDNVLLGIDLTAYWKRHTFYIQFLLDEFVWNEVKNKTKWWASKYAGQIGLKGYFKKNKNNFFYRLEYNFARPYTYAHLSEGLNYGNQGAPLAHPYGANFMEVLAELKWQQNRWMFSLFSNYYLRGKSVGVFNYGEDVYTSYINRPYEYGHFIGQGRGVNGTKTIISAFYQLRKTGNLSAFIENHFIGTTLQQPNYFVVVGLRNILWNDRRNY